MSFEKVRAEHMRLVVLRVLAEDSNYSHNEHVLREALDMYGHRISSDKLRTELSWLSEQALINLAKVSDTTWVASLSPRGLDAAQGRVVVPGVKRPGPEDI